MKQKNWLRLILGVTVLTVSLTTGSVSHAQISTSVSDVAFGPFPSLPSPLPLPPRVDPKGSGDGL